jgi:hypothetical protein
MRGVAMIEFLQVRGRTPISFVAERKRSVLADP